ncbi:hypothetical protein QBC32DRAFT_401760 [Pseudoneurospora amorphoporcata]|uniref:Uncharacterized protein n=1 Tax=Pseudoneurospora amorphoporcata TaxID=241081 RepID=A0AAN6NJV6_9PEZI|nr:hypothetical protein QBC32DRAFT_401760 [Pseudoneurospora amorphoporcata]
MNLNLDNNPADEVVYDNFPVWWLAHVATLPFCVKCGAKAPQLGQSCPPCVNSRPADKLRRKLAFLMVTAMRKLETVADAVESASDADSLFAGTEHAMKAVMMVPSAYHILLTAQETLDQLAELDAWKAELIAPNLLGAVERYQETRILAKDIFASAATAWLEQGNEHQGYMEGLARVDHFVSSIPMHQNDDHVAEQPEHHEQNHIHQQHAQDRPLQEDDDVPIQHQDEEAIQQHHEYAVEEENKDQEIPRHQFHHAFVDIYIPEDAVQQPDRNHHRVDNFLLHDDNLALLAAPNEGDEIDGPDWDDILFNPYFQNQLYNPLHQLNR